MDPIGTDARGRLDIAQLERALPEDPDDPQFSLPSALCLENTANRAGGVPLAPADTAEAVAFAVRNRLAVHLDGARIFNASVALGVPAAEVAREADSVQFCLSKGLSAPIGSVVTGSAEFVTRVRRVRKMLGGGMRQAGVIAAAGIVALDTMVDRLAEDHARARRLADGLAGIAGLSVAPERVRTNIVLFRVANGWPSHRELIGTAGRDGVRLAELGRGQIRAVTHRGVDDRGIEHALRVIAAAVR
jgi:threonine aldolase